MNRIVITACMAVVMLSGMSIGIAYAGSFTITTRPLATIVVNSTTTGRLVTTRGHLAAIQYNMVNGVQVVTVTVTP